MDNLSIFNLQISLRPLGQTKLNMLSGKTDSGAEPMREEAPPKTVLVVDDSRMQRRILSASLRKSGYNVIEADCGQRAMEICRKIRIPMVISDWVMPGMSGPKFCQLYRRLDPDDYGYFLLLTSKHTSEEIAEGLNSGADDFLTKPVNMGELQARMKAGERILKMQSELIGKNAQIQDALMKAKRLYAELERDLKEARNLQQSLIPETDTEIPEGRISMMLHPSGHVGGDLVGKFHISDRELGLFSLDVSGHGVSSALMTARLAASLNGQSPEQNVAMRQNLDGSYSAISPARAAERLNRVLLREIETEHYFTLALAIVDLATGHVRAVQAGHPHPIILSRKGGTSAIGTGGMPIGLLPEAEFTEFDFTLAPGDRLVLYSDGITECENPMGAYLEEDGLRGLLRKVAGRKGPEFLADLLHETCEFADWREFSDDVSVLVFEFNGASGNQRPRARRK